MSLSLVWSIDIQALSSHGLQQQAWRTARLVIAQFTIHATNLKILPPMLNVSGEQSIRYTKMSCEIKVQGRT